MQNTTSAGFCTRCAFACVQSELIREAEVMKKMDHKHIVRLIGECDWGGGGGCCHPFARQLQL